MDKNPLKKAIRYTNYLSISFRYTSLCRYLVTVNDFFMLTPFIMKTSYFSFFFIHLWCPSLCSVCMNHGRKCVSLFAQVSWETTFLQNLFPGSMEEAMKGKIWREIRVLVVRNRGPYIGGRWAGWRIQKEKVWIPLKTFILQQGWWEQEVLRSERYN